VGDTVCTIAIRCGEEWLDQVYQYAEPVQPYLPRGGEGDEQILQCYWCWIDSGMFPPYQYGIYANKTSGHLLLVAILLVQLKLSVQLPVVSRSLRKASARLIPRLYNESRRLLKRGAGSSLTLLWLGSIRGLAALLLGLVALRELTRRLMLEERH
jgi:hypothetical protein